MQGLFGISEDHIENYQSLDERFIKFKVSTFFFEASSEAMSPYVEKGDILIVDRSLTPMNNQIVIAAVNGELVCRRICFNQNKVVLFCDNKQFSSIEMSEESDLLIWGVVRALARDVL